MLRALLFDKDGTLVDFHATWGPATRHAVQELSGGDANLSDALMEIADYDRAEGRLRPGSPLIAGSSADYGPDWARVLGEAPGDGFNRRLDAVFGAAALASVAEVAEAGSVLSTLAGRGYRLGMLTNDSEAAALQQCERLGHLPHLKAVIGYDTGHGRKPAPGPVLAFARQIGVEPQAVAVIGDSVHDLAAARAAGALAIAVLSGPADRATLAPHADQVIDSIADLPALLERLAGQEAR